MGIAAVNVCDLPSCNIRLQPGGIEEGLAIATAGFPMGQQLINDTDGQIMQLSPVLQSGIISAVHPFPVPTPSGFTVNILLQNGASGSPVFLVDSGEVIGVAVQRKFERLPGSVAAEDGKTVTTTDGQRLITLMNLPTNYSFAVPTVYLAPNINSLKDSIIEDLKKETADIGRNILNTREPAEFRGD